VEFGGLDAPLSDAPIQFLKRRVRRAFPGITWKGESAWRGHRPSTLDSLPFVGASPKLSQIYFAFGAQHIGLTSGPKTGRLIADLIGGRRPNIDLTPFRVGRFD
jgi:D-amino-acid dehydrogenase